LESSRDGVERPVGLGGDRRGVLLDLLVLMGLVLFSFWVRVDTAARDETFTQVAQEGLLKSDPGLLYYLTEKVALADGLIPPDWSADERIAYPALTNIPADYTVGQEFLLGWSWRAFGNGVSLFQWCHYGAALLAALSVIGVWGLARELCVGRQWAAAAALTYLALPASYRTIGFVLVREDLSWPLFIAHLWLAARAARLRTRSAALMATILAAAALATWHAMSMVLAIEAVIFVLLHLVRGRNVMARHGVWVLGGLGCAWMLVPALGGGAFIGGVLLLVSLFLAPRLRPSQPRIACALLIVACASVFSLLHVNQPSDFSHVMEVMLAKIRHGGVLPADPTELSFDARLLWQGPFASLSLQNAFGILGVALLLGVPACLACLFARSDLAYCLGLFGLASLAASWFVVRLSSLPALLLPALILFALCQVLGSLRRRIPNEPSERNLALLASKTLPALALVALLGQCLFFQEWRAKHQIFWYRSSTRSSSILEMVTAVKHYVPSGDAVASDFVNSAALLASTDHAILLQPKWERSQARKRVQDFWNALYAGSPAELKSLLKDEYECRYLLVDKYILWTLNVSRYVAGFQATQKEPRAATAAELFLGTEFDEQEALSFGYRLVWESDALGEGQGSPNYRLLALD
jgi:hypothetical protein